MSFLNYQMLIGVSFCCVGILFLYRSVRDLKKARLSKNWPNSYGEVISSETEAEDARKAGNLFKVTTVFVKYSINNTEYSSYIACYEKFPGQYEEIVKKYPGGKYVMVYYNPSDPKDAVLEPRASLGIYYDILFCLIFIYFGLIMVFGYPPF